MTRKTEKPLVRIVDDDPDQLASLEIMLSAEGWDVACYERASDFFAEDTPSRPGCLILDVRMPEISGLEMQEELKVLLAKVNASMKKRGVAITSAKRERRCKGLH